MWPAREYTVFSRQDKQAGPKVKSRIPEFINREEEAEFWDIHEITVYQDESSTVRVRFAKCLSEGIGESLARGKREGGCSREPDRDMDP